MGCQQPGHFVAVAAGFVGAAAAGALAVGAASSHWRAQAGHFTCLPAAVSGT
jgi:hypothetical protein